MLVTLGDRHHLDGLVVIGNLVIIRRTLWMAQVMVWAVVSDSPDGVSKNQPVEST